MKTGQPQAEYLSIHIPKTAGVTIRNLLKEHFGPGFVLYYWQITDAWGRVCEKIPAGATCIHGHYQTDHLTGLYPRARLITWVRDPVERVLSSYHYRLRAPDPRHPICHELHTKKLSVAEYAALPLVRNEMTRFFGRNQPADFHFIGIVEEFAQSLALLGQLLDCPAFSLRQDNANPDKPAGGYLLDPAVRREILTANEQDADLYADCVRRWGSRRADRCA